MLPLPIQGLGHVELPQLPPAPSGPNPSGPSFRSLYDRLSTGAERGALPPSPLEVPPVLAPSSSLQTPFVASPEFAGAVDPDALRLPGQSAPGAVAGVSAGASGLFDPIKQGLQHVSALQKNAQGLANEAALGGDVDLHDVTIAAEKASVAMQLTIQLRNKVVDAYQEVMRMQV